MNAQFDHRGGAENAEGRSADSQHFSANLRDLCASAVKVQRLMRKPPPFALRYRRAAAVVQGFDTSARTDLGFMRRGSRVALWSN
jgi:hypothetical protein